ncbi:MAG: YIP1 family protein [Simkaniaceae bacterium]|nr:YIP1 family protein [Simkaniaceae bacterium]
MEGLRLNPWFSMWIHPRKTMRAILESNVNYRFNWLCFFYGFLFNLNSSRSIALGSTYSFPAIFIAAVILAWPVGYIVFTITSALFFWVGKWFKGSGSYLQVRSAVAWSAVPVVANILLWFIIIGLFGAGVLAPTSLDTVNNGILGLFTLQFILNVWSFILLLHAYGEVQGFSAWRSLPVAIIAFILWVIISFAFFTFVFWAFGCFSQIPTVIRS